jgi:endoglucanase
LSASAPVSFEAALIPFLLSSGEQAEATRLQQNVMAEISKSTGLLDSPARYYDQNLALFALGWREQRFRFAPDGTLRVRWKK